MKIITVLSGKGGVGKSSTTASLAVLLARSKRIVAVDCDVDAPNLGLCLGLPDEKFSWRKVQTSEKAELDPEKCTGCKKCLNICVFDAITWDNKNNRPVFNNFLCEGCVTCQLVCEQNAILLRRVENGRIGVAATEYGFNLVTGQLEIGESGSGKIVIEVKNKAREIGVKDGAEVMLVDSSAGIGCPVIASVNGSDYVIAVTEPTPSAFNDLKRALQVVEHFRIPYGIIINKWDLNKEFSENLESFANENNIPILEKIPYNKGFVEALVNLKPLIIWDKKFENTFTSILKNMGI